MFDFVLLQLHRQVVLKTLIHADLAATAPNRTTTQVRSTGHDAREIGKPDITSMVDLELKHSLTPLLFLDINASAPTTTEIDAIGSGLLIRRQKGHNSDPTLKNLVVPLPGNYPVSDSVGYSHTNPIENSLIPLDTPFFPPLTHDTPRRELMGSWGQRRCQPGFSCSKTITTRGTGNARTQPIRIPCCRAKKAPSPPIRRTPALQVARGTTPTTSRTPSGPYDTPTKGERLSQLT